MSSYGRWRYDLRTSYSMIIFFFFFLTFLPLNLKTQGTFFHSSHLSVSLCNLLFLCVLWIMTISFLEEIAEVFDSSQDHLLIHSGVYGNRRSLIETSFPGKSPVVDASPPSPAQSFATTTEPSPPPETQTPPEDEIPRPSSSEQAKPPTPRPVTPSPPFLPPSLPLPPSLSPPSVTEKKSSKVHMIVGIVVGVFTVSVALIIFFLILSRKIPIKPWTNSGQLQDAFITGKTHSSVFTLSLFLLSSSLEFL